MANQYLALGMFIMLLSFFLVLNSMSTFDEGKSQAVIESVSDAFMTQAPAEEDFIADTITRPSDDFRQGSTLDNIKALFEATIPDTKSQKNRFGNVMSVQIPRADFEAALKGNATPQGIETRERFSTILAGLIGSKDAIAYEMDILLNHKENPADVQKNNPLEARKYIKVAASYSQILEKEGLDRKQMTSGITKGNPNMVTLVFRRYSPMKWEGIQ